MKFNKKFIIYAGLLYVIYVLLILFLYNKNRPIQYSYIPPRVEEVLDVELLTENETASDVQELINQGLPVPKNITEVELMSDGEKFDWGMDPSIIVQVLGRTEEGMPLGFRVIPDVNAIAIDYSQTKEPGSD